MATVSLSDQLYSITGLFLLITGATLSPICPDTMTETNIRIVLSIRLGKLVFEYQKGILCTNSSIICN